MARRRRGPSVSEGGDEEVQRNAERESKTCGRDVLVAAVMSSDSDAGPFGVTSGYMLGEGM